MDIVMCMAGEIGKIVVNKWKKDYSFQYNVGILFITKKGRISENTFRSSSSLVL